MQALVALVVVAASVAIAIWSVQLMRRTNRELREAPADEQGGAVEMWKASLGGAIVAVPAFAFDWLNAPSWVFIAWLTVVTALLGWLLIRGRRHAGQRDSAD